MAAVLAVCQSQASGSRIFLFIDNEAARASLIAMYSPRLVHAKLPNKFSEVVTSRFQIDVHVGVTCSVE